MKKLQLLLGLTVATVSFTSCKSEEEKMAEKTFDRYEKYVDSVNSVNEAEAYANWQAIEAGYNVRLNDADAALINMKDQTNAQNRIDKAKAKYAEFQTKVEATAPKPVDRKVVIRDSYFGEGRITDDNRDFSWVNKDNILKVYNDFYNEFEKNKDSYSREDFDEIKA